MSNEDVGKGALTESVCDIFSAILMSRLRPGWIPFVLISLSSAADTPPDGAARSAVGCSGCHHSADFPYPKRAGIAAGTPEAA